MGTDATTVRRRPLPEDEDSSVEELNARLDHISSNVHPVTPYILTIPSQTPVHFNQEQQRQFWVKGTLFSYNEGQLQYISNFSDWGQGLIHPVGGWDDGNGSIARQDRTPQESAMTPQPPTKKIKLGDYAKKRAAVDVKAGQLPPSPRVQIVDRSKPALGDTARKSENPARRVMATENNQRLNKFESQRPLATTSHSSPTRPSHESLLPSEDIPPPLTPLPPRLAAAVAEYREHLKSQSVDKPGSGELKSLANKAYRRYQKRQEAFLPPGAANGSGRLLVTLKFRKRRPQFRKFLSSQAKSSTRESSPNLVHDHDAVAKLNRLGEELLQTGYPATADEFQLTQLEGILCKLAYTCLSHLDGPESREQWESDLRFLSEFAERCEYEYVPVISVTRIDDRSSQRQELLSHLIESLMSLIHRELADYYGSATNGEKCSELAFWLRSEAYKYSLRASKSLNAKRLARMYPKVWDDSSESSSYLGIEEVFDWTTAILKGPFCFPLTSGSTMEAVRGARKLLMRFCFDADIEPSDHLGAFAAKRDATA